MRFFRTVVFVMVLSTMLALGCASVEPRITKATLGTQVQAGRIVMEMSRFAPTDRMLHLVVDVENVVGNVTIGAKWYKVADADSLLFESELGLDPLNTSADFVLTNTNNWLPGNYKVVVYLNEKESRALNFKVE